MPKGDLTLRMFLNQERPSAVQVANRAERDMAGIWWLPRSLIGYARKDPPASPGERPPYTFTLPEWKVEQENLWDYVKD
jgi:hypothetical protein